MFISNGSLKEAPRGPQRQMEAAQPRAQAVLSEEIARQLPLARQGPRTAWAYRIIDNYLWFWTADGEDEQGEIGRDKLKYSFDFLWHSQAACGLSRAACAARRPEEAATDLRHEHAVPKSLIQDRLLRSPGIDAKEVMAVLEQHCRAVILTNEEDKKLNKFFRNSMPSPWDIDDPNADPFARYKHQALVCSTCCTLLGMESRAPPRLRATPESLLEFLVGPCVLPERLDIFPTRFVDDFPSKALLQGPDVFEVQARAVRGSVSAVFQVEADSTPDLCLKLLGTFVRDRHG